MANFSSPPKAMITITLNAAEVDVGTRRLQVYWLMSPSGDFQDIHA
jgi:hypothetical protein